MIKALMMGVAATVAGIALSVQPAHAKTATKAAAKTETTGPKKSRMLRFGELTIEGEGKNPQVYYLLNRKRVELGHKPVEQDLLPPVADTVRGEPF